MTTHSIKMLAVASLSFLAAPARADASGPACHPVHASMVEDVSTTCRPPATRCFYGSVLGGITGTTYFYSDSAAAGPATSPGWVSYSGLFEYTTERGTLSMRETGIVNRTTGTPDSGAVTAYQTILAGSDALEGATGHLYVSGHSINGHVETEVTGELCLP